MSVLLCGFDGTGLQKRAERRRGVIGASSEEEWVWLRHSLLVECVSTTGRLEGLLVKNMNYKMNLGSSADDVFRTTRRHIFRT